MSISGLVMPSRREPVKADVSIAIPMPTSWSGRRKLREQCTAHTQRPDVDNLVKVILVVDAGDGFRYQDPPEMRRVVVGVDPSISDGEDAAECGIVVAGEGVDGTFYVLADRSLRGSLARWGRAVVDAWLDKGADRVVAEENQGGKMVELTLRTIEADIPYRGATIQAWIRRWPSSGGTLGMSGSLTFVRSVSNTSGSPGRAEATCSIRRLGRESRW